MHRMVTVNGENDYHVPTKNVLVLGCIDLRLTDETMAFLNQDNLQNRFDYFTLAGTSLCTCGVSHKADFKPDVLSGFGSFKHWDKTLEDHVKSAIALHQIQDVYIIEHRDCGAYKEFLKNGKFTPAQAKQELAAHQKYSSALATRLEQIDTIYLDATGVVHKTKLKAHVFLIDLRGDVTLLWTNGKKYAKAK